jgi:hypothetical protein
MRLAAAAAEGIAAELAVVAVAVVAIVAGIVGGSAINCTDSEIKFSCVSTFCSNTFDYVVVGIPVGWFEDVRSTSIRS